MRPPRLIPLLAPPFESDKPFYSLRPSRLPTFFSLLGRNECGIIHGGLGEKVEFGEKRKRGRGILATLPSRDALDGRKTLILRLLVQLKRVTTSLKIIPPWTILSQILLSSDYLLHYKCSNKKYVMSKIFPWWNRHNFENIKEEKEKRENRETDREKRQTERTKRKKKIENKRKNKNQYTCWTW